MVFNSLKLERVLVLANAEFKLRYYGNRLGLLWALIGPLSQVVIFYVVFQVIMKQHIENYALYVFAGMIFWNVFADTTTRGITLLKRQRQLYENTDMDKIEIYFAMLISESIGFLFNLFIFYILGVFTGVYPTWHLFFGLIIYLNIMVLTLGFTLILSNFYLILPDITQVWNIVLRIVFFLSPILFEKALFGERVPYLMYLNPMSGIIDNCRNVMMYGMYPDWEMLGFNLIYSLVILLIGIFIHKRLSPLSSELA